MIAPETTADSGATPAFNAAPATSPGIPAAATSASAPIPPNASHPARRVFRPQRSPVSASTEGEPRRSDHQVTPLPRGRDAPPPADRIPGFPAIRPLPYPIEAGGVDPVMPLTEPFVSAADRAFDRDPDNFELRMSDFSIRGRQMFTPADRRSHRVASSSPTSSSDGSDEDDDFASSIGSESDLGDGSPDEPDAIGGSTVLPPASTITGPVDVEAEIPRSEIPPYGGPYVVQLELPQDYITTGVDVRTRIRVNVRHPSFLSPICTNRSHRTSRRLRCPPVELPPTARSILPSMPASADARKNGISSIVMGSA